MNKVSADTLRELVSVMCELAGSEGFGSDMLQALSGSSQESADWYLNLLRGALEERAAA